MERFEDRRLLSAVAPGQALVVPSAARAPAAAVVNAAPVISAIPDAAVNVGSAFAYQVVATGTPTPTFQLSSAPGGMAINRATGQISWAPTAGQVGSRTVTVRATNTVGSASRSFRITVTNFVAPTITTPTGLTATAGAAFSYQMAATGSPAPAFALVSGPQGITVSPAGLISWSPPAGQTGAQNVTVSAANAAGAVSSTFAVNVVPDTTAPTAPFLSVGPITATDSIPLSWSGSTDNVGVAGYRIYSYTPAVYRGHSGRGGGYTLVSPARYTLLADKVTASGYTFTGLTPNTTYRYAVAAYDAAGNQSPYSAVVTGTTLLAPSFTWTSNGVNTDPALSDVANHPLSFELYTAGSPNPTLTLVSAPAGVTFTPGQITNSQLTFVIPTINWTPTADEVGTQYITMRADNSVGSYTYSIPVTVTPDTPQLSVSLNGGTVYGSQQFAAGPSDYKVTANYYFGGPADPQYGLSGTPFNFQVTAASNTSPTTFTLVSGPAGMSLDPATGAGTWSPAKADAGNTAVQVSATNAAGTSTLELNFPTYFTGAPGLPSATYYTATPATATTSPSLQPTLSWAAPADTSGIADYRITVTAAGTGAVTTFDTQGAATSYTLSGLNNLQYFATVTPLDAGGNPGLTSPTVSVYAAALPRVGWTVGSPAVVGQPLGVQFQSFGGGPLSYSILSGPAGASIDPATGLLSWTPDQAGDATIVVAADSPNGWGTIAAVLNLPVFFTDAPASLAVTAGSDPTSGAATLTATWSPPSVNLTTIAAYEVQVLSPATSPSPLVIDVPAAAPLAVSLSDLGITTGSIRVSALDAAGDAGLSSPWVTF